MPPLLNTLIDIWPVVSNLAPLLLAAAMIYFRTQFPTKADFDVLSRTVTDLANRLTITTTSVDHLSAEQESAPTRVELLNKIASLEGRISGLEGAVGGIRHQLDTTNDYLKILVDRGISR